MKNVKMLTLVMAGVLCVPFYANAESASDQWGNWSAAHGEQDKFFSAQTVTDSEVLEAETASIDIQGNEAFIATQLAGSPDVGLDTDQNVDFPTELKDGVKDIQLKDTLFMGLDTDDTQGLDDLGAPDVDGAGAAGTQLEGTPFVGLDTDGQAEGLDDILARQ